MGPHNERPSGAPPLEEIVGRSAVRRARELARRTAEPESLLERLLQHAPDRLGHEAADASASSDSGTPVS